MTRYHNTSTIRLFERLCVFFGVVGAKKKKKKTAAHSCKSAAQLLKKKNSWPFGNCEDGETTGRAPRLNAVAHNFNPFRTPIIYNLFTRNYGKDSCCW
jgi:hypothetical protein